MILDYSQRIKFESEERKTNGVISVEKRVPDPRFFGCKEKCPFCNMPTEQKHHDDDGYDNTLTQVVINEHIDRELWVCTICGWWQVEVEHTLSQLRYSDSHGQLDEDFWRLKVIRSILRSYNPSDIDLPISALKNTLKKKPSVIHEIHPRKMEEVVQSVFRDFYHCEVEHCGRSHDEGVDLILINSDKPALVQIKRRTNPESVEPVSSVREFLGAIVLKGHKSGIFVTTAHHFSKEAKRAAQSALEMNLVSKFDLINRDRFLDILSITAKKGSEPWRNAIRSKLQTGTW